MINLYNLSDIARSTETERSDFPLGGILKRQIDIWGALFGLVIFSPLFLLVAMLVKLSDGGSVFYGHKRIGFGGSVFRCWKFRTMSENSDLILAEHLQNNIAARAEWESTQKLVDDPRVTAVGDVLRKLSIDELPQLVNVLLGDMSIVGPRPVVNAELKRYGRSLNCYLLSRPGLTGLWQVSGRSDVSYESRVAFDRQYVESWSAAKDILIIFRTVPAVLMQKGSR